MQNERIGGGRPPAAVPIPGAQAWQGSGSQDDWAVAVGTDAGTSLSASLHDGLFGSSLRARHNSEGFGSMGYGHGAWLSSSPHPASWAGQQQRGGGLHRTPSSLQRQTSLPPQPSPAHTADYQRAAAALDPYGGGEPDLEGAPSAGVGTPASPLSPSVIGRRNSSDQPRPAHLSQPPQRWHLGGGPRSSLDLAEPLLSGELSDVAAPSPVPQQHQQQYSDKAAAAAAAAALPAAPRVVAERGDGGEGDQGANVPRALVFGAINSIATIPSLVAYASIVFKDPAYTPYIDQLCKFFFLSSALHQAVFCLLSTLPFSVGQVQDVGLIFLSAMATSIASICQDAGKDVATALGTSLLTMSMATFFTGAMTLLVARYKMGQLVQYLPLPVIGGYLSFVGYFCIASGIGLGVSEDIGSLTSWVNLFNRDALIKLVPTLLSCLAMIFTLEHFTHPLALPAVLVAINLAFHLVRLAMGVTLQQAMDANWVIRPAEGEQYFWELWDLFNISDWRLSGIYFPAMAQQVVKALGLCLVVIFGSAMDIAAIQQDTPKKIDFDRELMTVAASNMATGVAGCGYTGSYIFSQTIFTMRAGVFSRWNGIVVAVSEAVMFALPFPVIQYMPNFFFGSLLLWFGIEISRDWLVVSYSKMTRIEYCLLLSTFAAIMQWGLEGGIAAGIVLATLYFALAYAKSQVASIGVVGSAHSSVVRTVEQQAALDMLTGRLSTVCLSGFIFFGSANSIGNKLQEEATRLGSLAADAAALEASGNGSQHSQQQQADVEQAIVNSLRTMGEAYVGVKHTQAVAALAAAPAYLVIDFSAVRGVDATGARTMGVVHSELAQQGVVLVITDADHHGIRPLLLAHGVPLPPKPLSWPPELATPRGTDSVRGSQVGSPRSQAAGAAGNGNGVATPSRSLAAEQAWEDGGVAGIVGLDDVAPTCLEFCTLEGGLRYCEDQLLEVAVRYGLCLPPSALLPLEDMLHSHLQKLPVGAGLDPRQAATTLRRYMTAVSLAAGQLLWRVDDPASDYYIIEEGSVRVDEFVHASDSQGRQGRPRRHRHHTSGSGTGSGLDSSSASSLPEQLGSGRRVLARSYECGAGCVAGTTDFFLARPHATRAVCRSPAAKVLRISRAAMERMAVEVPQALNVLQAALMRANTLDLSMALATHTA